MRTRIPAGEKLPATGQTTCHDTAGARIACPGSGQDAEFRAGAPWPAPRFAVDGAEVLDRLTGLTWTRDANRTRFPVSWQEAFDHVTSMNRRGDAGAGAWRLPNRRELRSLVSHDTRRPALPGDHPFENVWNGWYWTSTTAAVNPEYAWYVHMDGARMFYGRKDEDHLVWPVRGAGNGILACTGQTRCHDAAGRLVPCRGTGHDGELRAGRPWPGPRFEVEGEVVLDRLTGLLWTRSADLAGGEVAWAEALAAVAAVPAGGHARFRCPDPDRPWRLPNILELESLVDCDAHSPALPSGHPFRDVREDYWSSTTSMFEADWAWALYLAKGAVGVGQKKARCFSVWAVYGPLAGRLASAAT